ncbi:MAG: M42 family metallopeptidase [bacterium]
MIEERDIIEGQVILDLDILATLTNLFGPAGNEEEVINYISSIINQNNLSFVKDSKGNLISVKDIEKSDFKVLIASHVDEVGFIVSQKIEPHYLKVEPLGGWIPQILPSTKVLIKTKNGFVKGVFSSIPPHLSKNMEIKSFSDLYVDVGDNFQFVEVGNFLTPDSQFEIVSQSLIMGKAFDNRIGTYVNLHLLKYVEPSIDVFHLFLVQEELGLRGSKFFAKNNPQFDLVIVIETTSAENPHTNEQVSYLNRGPVLTIMDKTYITNPKLVEIIKEIALVNEIPLQIKRPNIGSTDAGHLQDLGNVIIISIPAKYIHSPYQISSIQDIQNTIKLISLLISTPNIEEIYKRVLS